MATFCQLSFDIVEHPSWRKSNASTGDIPCVSTMVDQILEYRKIWQEFERKNGKTSKIYRSVKKEMYLEFLYQIQRGEDIGILNRKIFEEIVNDQNGGLNLKPGVKRYGSKEENEAKSKYRKSDSDISIGENSSFCLLQTNYNSSTNEEDNNSLPTSPEAKQYFDTPSNKQKETLNLLKGYQHLNDQLKEIPRSERDSFLGIIDVETCIKDCHKILMKELVDITNTPPGKFSTVPRSAEFEGEHFFYPAYKTEEIAYDAVQVIVDEYNWMIDKISEIKDDRLKIINSFKCASLLLFSFLTLHPFSDGNGRLARLLCNYCLNTFCRFLRPFIITLLRLHDVIIYKL